MKGRERAHLRAKKERSRDAGRESGISHIAAQNEEAEAEEEGENEEKDDDDDEVVVVVVVEDGGWKGRKEGRKTEGDQPRRKPIPCDQRSVISHRTDILAPNSAKLFSETLHREREEISID